jgi:hypothetical protein
MYLIATKPQGAVEAAYLEVEHNVQLVGLGLRHTLATAVQVGPSDDPDVAGQSWVVDVAPAVVSNEPGFATGHTRLPEIRCARPTVHSDLSIERVDPWAVAFSHVNVQWNSRCNSRPPPPLPAYKFITTARTKKNPHKDTHTAGISTHLAMASTCASVTCRSPWNSGRIMTVCTARCREKLAEPVGRPAASSPPLVGYPRASVL